MDSIVGSRKHIFLALLVAIPLWILNNLAIIGGWLNTPEGYVPAGLNVGQDEAQYILWAAAFKTQNTIPNYHLPWRTEPGFIQPLFWVLARLSAITQIGFLWWFRVLGFLWLWMGIYFLQRLICAYLQRRSQVSAAWIAIFCSLPLASLKVVPWLIAQNFSESTLGGWLGSVLPGDPAQLPGFYSFILATSDGLIHGLATSPLITFGTAMTLAFFLHVERYSHSFERPCLVKALGVVFLTALIHPFEALLMAGAGGLVLLGFRGREWPLAIPQVALLGAVTAAGLSPYLYAQAMHAWVRDVASLNRWTPPSPLGLPLLLGIPTILVLVLTVLPPRLKTKQDLILQIWFVFTLISIYLPLPWTQHLLDGFLYCSAILLVRQGTQSCVVQKLWAAFPRLCRTAVAALCILCFGAYFTYYRQCFLDGSLSSNPVRFLPGVISKEHVALVDWFREKATLEQLVLTSRREAAWLVTVPMHSFASHRIFGLTYEAQSRLRDSFYSGELKLGEARKLIFEFGVSYVVVPMDSPSLWYFHEIPEAVERARIGSFAIFEFPGNTMKPYPGLELATRITSQLVER